MAAGNATIGALKVSLGLDSAQFEDGLKSAQSSLGKFGKTAGVAVAAAVTAATAAVTALGVAVKGVIDYADEMDKAAQKFGVPIEDLTRLKYAAEMSNVSFEALGTGLRKLAQNMHSTAADGTGKAAEAFEMLGIKVETANGNLRSQSEVMGDLAEKFATMPDGAQKTALAMGIFGKSGADLIPILNEGKAGLKALTDEADRFGLVIGQETAHQADRFNDNLEKMGKIWDGLKIKLTSALLPYLQRLSDLLLGFVNNDAAIQAVFQGVSDGVAAVATTTATAVIKMVELGKTLAAIGQISAGVLSANGGMILEGIKGIGAASDESDARLQTLKTTLDTIFKPDSDAWDLMGDVGSLKRPANDNEGDYAGGSKKDERDQEKLDREREMLERKLEQLKEFLGYEQEAEFMAKERRLADLKEMLEAELLTTQEYAQLRGDVEEEHNRRVRDLRLEHISEGISSAKSFFSDLSTIMGREGDKQFAIVKALGIAEAIVNTYKGVTAALADSTVPTWVRFANAAAVAASGFAQVAKIRGTSKSSTGGGGGGVSSGGGGGAAAPAAQAGPNAGQSMFVTFKGNFDGPGVEQIAKQLIEYQRDGGQVVLNRAA